MENLILLVEDNPDDEALTLRALRRSHVLNEVVVVHDGAEALDYFHGTGRHADRDISILPYLVLLDLKLPKVGGLEVLRRLRTDERTKLLPVVILTSSKDENEIVHVSEPGPIAYISKPLVFAQLAEAMSKLQLSLLIADDPTQEKRAG